MKKIVIGFVAALGLVLSTGSGAMAGEVNGNGDPIPGAHNASSECAFSGQDTQDASAGGTEMNPPGFDDDALAARGTQAPAGVARYHGVQNYGMFAKAGLKDMPGLPNPGQACRGNG